jgi:hypothetical protein
VPRNFTASRHFKLRMSLRTDRAIVCAAMLRDGEPLHLLNHIDGNLLVDIWDDLDLPSPIRRAWLPLCRRSTAPAATSQHRDTWPMTRKRTERGDPQGRAEADGGAPGERDVELSPPLAAERVGNP